jgi:hypothetical protein
MTTQELSAGPQPIEADPTRTEFAVPECNLPELLDRIEKLAKRSRKLGLTPPVIVQTGEHEDRPVKERDEETGEWVVTGYVRYHKVRLEGQAPVLPGWSLVAVVEHTTDSEIGNVVRTVPGQECPTTYRTAGCWCEHCKTARRRTETFVIKNDAGEYRQIGRNCLADFCRDPERASQLCSWAEYMASARELCEGSEDSDFFGCGGRTVQRTLTDTTLALTARIVRHQGWMSRGAARKLAEQGRYVTATADTISEILYDRDFFKANHRDSLETIKLREAARDVQDQDRERAAKALEWVRGMRGDAANLGDYLYNLLVVATGETVERKHLGLLCSAISAYEREVERVEYQRRERVASTHFGEVGKRGDWTFKVLSVREFESQYGIKYLVRFDREGSIAIWWATSSAAGDLEVGSEVKVRGTVKKHGDYKGTAQTELTRCAIVAMMAAARNGASLAEVPVE